MRIESLRVQNYKVLRDVRLDDIAPMAVLLGANGSGKSTLLDVFAFLRDCVRYGVRTAVDHRGGYWELLSRGTSDKLDIELTLTLEKEGPLLVYNLVLDGVEDAAFIFRESLTSSERETSKETVLFQFNVGVGEARADYADPRPPEHGSVDSLELSSTDVLALNALGLSKRYATAAAMRREIESIHHATLTQLDFLRATAYWPTTSLSPSGDNLAEFAREMFVNHRSRFEDAVGRAVRQVPGLSKVQPIEASDGRISLEFADHAFETAFPARFISEGTRKLFAILLMLHEAEPHPLLTCEEPENDLYPQIVRPLAEEFRAYAERGSQVFVSTHSPDFVNGLELDELYWMEKRDGFARVVRAKDDPNLVAQHVEGELLGSLWREGLFGKVDPL